MVYIVTKNVDGFYETLEFSIYGVYDNLETAQECLLKEVTGLVWIDDLNAQVGESEFYTMKACAVTTKEK